MSSHEKNSHIEKEKSILTNIYELFPWKTLIAGGIAGAASRTATAPIERLKILFQIQSMNSNFNQYTGVMQSFIKMFKEEGLYGFFKGNGTNVIRIAPYSAVQFVAFEQFKINTAKYLVNYQEVLLLSGGLAGITALILTYPLDLVRTRLTVQTTDTKYKGIMHTFKTVIKEEGIIGLYKGVLTSALGIAPYVAINFTTYENLKNYVRKYSYDFGVVASLACGGVAGATAQTITYPIDLLRRRMQLQGVGGTQALYSGPIDAAIKIVKKEGVVGLYRGMIPCYLKVIPSIAISFCTYEIVRKYLGIEQKTNFGGG